MWYTINFNMSRTPIFDVFVCPFLGGCLSDPTDLMLSLRPHIITIPIPLGVPTPPLEANVLNRWKSVLRSAQLVHSRQSSTRANCCKHSHRLSVIAQSRKAVLNARKALLKRLTVNVIAMKH